MFGLTNREGNHGEDVKEYFFYLDNTPTEPGASFTVYVRLTPRMADAPFADVDLMFDTLLREADEFYSTVHGQHLRDDGRLVQRQTYAGLLWSKQFYHYDVHHWLRGDPAQPPPPPERWKGRNHDWTLHFYNADVLLMPDKWGLADLPARSDAERCGGHCVSRIDVRAAAHDARVVAQPEGQ